MKQLWISTPILFSLSTLLVGCYPYDTTPMLCKDAVPEGGCPTGRGGTCEDPTCKALYDCIGGSWKKTSTCEPQSTGGAGGATSTGGQGGATSSGGSGGSGGGGGAGGCMPIQLDHTGDTTGCSPDLQSPDCPASLVEDCPETACQTDCTDFYLCKQEAGAPTWESVAYCDADGKLVISP